MRAVGTRLEMIELILKREFGESAPPQPSPRPAQRDWESGPSPGDDDDTVDLADAGMDVD
jgi:hypothetical protein